jgi:hypothetical protein
MQQFEPSHQKTFYRKIENPSNANPKSPPLCRRANALFEKTAKFISINP